jgi:uncharacterized protein (TIGR01777 family)
METVLITGASGLVGKALTRALRARGYDVVKLVRHPPSEPDEVQWAPGEFVAWPDDKPLDHVVHLAGEPVFGLWTPEKKKAIRESRVVGTRTMAEFCAARKQKPKSMISASAIGIYGDRNGEELTEASAPGSGFLAEVAKEWEAAAAPARQAGIRVVHPRVGVVLGKHGGALKQMLLPFQLGLGGRVGSGKQWFSWIALSDLLNLLLFAMETSAVIGPINAVAPEPVTNRDFTRVLAYVLNRPAIFPVPAFVLRRLPGGMADEALLASERVIPRKALDWGFRFVYPELIDALQAELGVSIS